MKKWLFAVLITFISFTSNAVETPSSMNNYIFSCLVYDKTPYIFAVGVGSKANVWVIHRVTIERETEFVVPATRIGISSKGFMTDNNFQLELFIPNNNGMSSLKVTQEGDHFLGFVKESQHGKEISTKDCDRYSIRFNPDNPLLKSEDLTWVD